ncbi:hypothetical protein PPTG_15551 [Phytophthora nicotianae INRA-310]|uniref:Tc1-like transposase DDE domain-containing protein n=1 Tax=Phytophthora nicotianae (strain INRA-310) TaxID=761204 RepID=W2PU62_PHYN3|nr:hypothetical protein PPTG_15551 [Phytophthora nicotianae INRA-310]ETN03565.1 hypothetical protein PPTG_15551 [Phytophthora nicotianae INRA-310]
MRGTKRSFRLGVDRAELYLDEPYCNVNHVTGKTWLTADKIRYVTEIANKYYHLVFFTSPFHPTLQPIEHIWGIVKGRIARTPPKSGADVVKKVLQGLEECDDEWLKAYLHVQKNEDAYIKPDRLKLLKITFINIYTFHSRSHLAVDLHIMTRHND